MEAESSIANVIYKKTNLQSQASKYEGKAESTLYFELISTALKIWIVPLFNRCKLTMKKKTGFSVSQPKESMNRTWVLLPLLIGLLYCLYFAYLHSPFFYCLKRSRLTLHAPLHSSIFFHYFLMLFLSNNQLLNIINV